MEFLLVDAQWKGELKLLPEVKAYIEKNNVKSVALFASVNFLNLNTVKKELETLGVTIQTTKAKRTHVETQILGCDVYHDAFQDEINADMILYVGDGLFHPKALVLATKKSVVIMDPVNEKVQLINEEDVEKQVKKLAANKVRYLAAQTIGILVTTKPGQQFLDQALTLKEKVEKEGKKAYIFVEDSINLQDLTNYPFIEAWVNTACPRIGTDDIVNIEQALINIRDA